MVGFDFINKAANVLSKLSSRACLQFKTAPASRRGTRDGNDNINLLAIRVFRVRIPTVLQLKKQL
jgi:hypothetical protein